MKTRWSWMKSISTSYPSKKELPNFPNWKFKQCQIILKYPPRLIKYEWDYTSKDFAQPIIIASLFHMNEWNKAEKETAAI